MVELWTKNSLIDGCFWEEEEVEKKVFLFAEDSVLLAVSRAWEYYAFKRDGELTRDCLMAHFNCQFLLDFSTVNDHRCHVFH